METHRLVMPGDLNQYGFLFGGKMLSWVDEACWIAASLDYPCLLYTSPSPRDQRGSRMPSSA